MKMKNYIKQIGVKTLGPIFSGLVLSMLISTTAFGAIISTQPQSLAVPQEKNYTVSVLLNSEGESLNAVQGSVTVNSALGDVVSVTDSGSVITYWVNPPKWDAVTRTVSFSGTIPGGYSGSAGILFSIVLPEYKGSNLNDALTFNNITALHNDGLGSSAHVDAHNFSLGITSVPVEPEVLEQIYTNDSKKDNVPPEIFSPQLAQDDRVFDNKWFINFSTTDKQSGIDHYEIQETRSGSIDADKWETASSPYVLKDQELHSYIYVIAIDRQGNERVIKVFPRNPLKWWQQYVGATVTIIVVIVFLGSIWYLRRRKQQKQNDRFNQKI